VTESSLLVKEMRMPAMWREWIGAPTCDARNPEPTPRPLFVCAHDGRYRLAGHERATSGGGHEPTREELLSDPIIVALMAADGVDPGALEAMLNRVGQCRSSARRRGQCVRAD
jgi:hypothetical protein